MTKENSVRGRVALVTGASRGIGLAIARRLGLCGARLSVCARQAEPLRQAAETLRSEGIEAVDVPADVTSPAQVAELVRRTNQALGEIDILVNNAGVGRFAALHELSEEDWDRVIDTNLKGTFLCSKAVAPGMIRKRSGHIVNIASLAGKNAFAGGAAYCASKWGLLGLTSCLAEDLRGYGIRASAICPGTVETEFSPHAGKDSSKMLQPEDVAHVVEMILLEQPQSFISEVSLRPTQKP
jgi:NAD(P)-dependent dehydrogenase (short-subunit alcohol dehydrogenase family)